jgi:hypothetical protein
VGVALRDRLVQNLDVLLKENVFDVLYVVINSVVIIHV